MRGRTTYRWTCRECPEDGRAPRAVAIAQANTHTLRTGHHVECEDTCQPLEEAS